MAIQQRIVLASLTFLAIVNHVLITMCFSLVLTQMVTQKGEISNRVANESMGFCPNSRDEVVIESANTAVQVSVRLGKWLYFIIGVIIDRMEHCGLTGRKTLVERFWVRFLLGQLAWRNLNGRQLVTCNNSNSITDSCWWTYPVDSWRISMAPSLWS